MLLAVLLGCGGGVADPRVAIRARLAAEHPSPADIAPIDERILLGQLPVACRGARSRVVALNAEEDWQALLLVSARLGARPVATGGCLPPEEGTALAAWAADRPGWRGERAEWLAAVGKIDEADALLAERGEDAARLRVALAKGDGEGARFAAEGALLEDARDVLACRVLGLAALAEGDAAWAVELASCGGVGTRIPELLRLRGDALDRAGEYAAAEGAYREAGADVHRAALIYQENPTPERLAEATRLLAPGPDGRPPPAALHALWMALLHGGEPSLDGLDGSIPATIARAVARGGDAELAALEDVPGAPAAVARATLHAARGDRAATEAALDDALAAAPTAEPVHRARVALRLRLNGDVERALADWAAQDPDHVAATGRGSRDVPWAAVVPETWAALAARHPDPRLRPDAPAGADAIGSRIRAARALPDPGARADALGSIIASQPGLDGLVSERYRSGPSSVNLQGRDP